MKFKPCILFGLLALGISVVASCAVTEPVLPEPLPRPRRQLFTIWLPLVKRAATKQGVALTHGHCGDVQWVGASWFYTWSPRPPECPGVESVPMIWGENDIGKTLRGTSSWLLGFNEPDGAGQANLTPFRAAELWRDVERLYPDKFLVSPAPSHLHPEWLPQFVAAYLDLYDEMPQLDALAVHCYLNDVDQCVALVGAAIALADDWNVTGGVWVTEFAFLEMGWATLEESLDKARTFIAWMDNEPRVGRYAWFAARLRDDEKSQGLSSALVEFDGSALTVYGEMYAER